MFLEGLRDLEMDESSYQTYGTEVLHLVDLLS